LIRGLEEVDADRSLEWVRQRNAIARARLEAWPDFAPTRKRLMEILDSQDRIPAVVRRGAFLYNFWQKMVRDLEASGDGPRLAEFQRLSQNGRYSLDLERAGQAGTRELGLGWIHLPRRV
jgi:prolyl oligopeptidase